MEALGTAIGGYAPDFELPGTDGSVHHLARYLENHSAIGVVFICNHCPYVQFYLERLKQLQAEFSPRGFTLIGINPNDAEQYPADGFEQMKAFVAEKGVNFPYLRDVTQDVAQTFGAEKTPHVFLVNQQGVLCYSGAIDDNAQDATAVSQPFLRAAIDQILAGQSIQPNSTEPVGCSVKWRK
ncbi:thioredoxin family protein [filamentous cyanobacterium LEGE 11480]|uniref:Thioredoxin family protein n=1 Tax=Romeriopsis navalis LEGE 11480 TaxID=2777977 RepID=A0A928VJR0_9CYAN|nr:thioredoxin family protein [Romeriopsis navalis]MBE9029893.1 thioredoxin family protein [Romeriopsis navalis LEGE 11480]